MLDYISKIGTWHLSEDTPTITAKWLEAPQRAPRLHLKPLQQLKYQQGRENDSTAFANKTASSSLSQWVEGDDIPAKDFSTALLASWGKTSKSSTWIEDPWRPLVRGRSKKMYRDRLRNDWSGPQPRYRIGTWTGLDCGLQWSPGLQHMWAAPGTGSRLPYSCIPE